MGHLALASKAEWNSPSPMPLQIASQECLGEDEKEREWTRAVNVSARDEVPEAIDGALECEMELGSEGTTRIDDERCRPSH